MQHPGKAGRPNHSSMLRCRIKKCGLGKVRSKKDISGKVSNEALFSMPCEDREYKSTMERSAMESAAPKESQFESQIGSLIWDASGSDTLSPLHALAPGRARPAGGGPGAGAAAGGRGGRRGGG